MARSYDMILGVDLDNVVADYTVGLRTAVAAMQGREPTLETYPDPDDWSYEAWGLDRDGFEDAHKRAVEEYGLFASMPVRPGAAEALQRLSDEGVRIRIVTARLFLPGIHEQTAAQTVGWLERHGIPYWDLCLISRKSDVGCHAYIDDSPGQIEALRAAGRPVIVMDWPYNRHLAGPRASGWEQAEQHVRDLLASTADQAA